MTRRRHDVKVRGQAVRDDGDGFGFYDCNGNRLTDGQYADSLYFHRHLWVQSEEDPSVLVPYMARSMIGG